jgi:hypothetical protein
MAKPPKQLLIELLCSNSAAVAAEMALWFWPTAEMAAPTEEDDTTTADVTPAEDGTADQATEQGAPADEATRKEAEQAAPIEK